MASNTPRLGLYKKDPVADANDTFNITTMLNDNWDRIDASVETIAGAQEKAEQAEQNAKTYADQKVSEHSADNAAHGIGNRSALLTTAKDTIVNAINELFTNVSNGKIQVRDAITGKGGTVTDADSDGIPTFQELTNGVNSIQVGDYKKGDSITLGKVSQETLTKEWEITLGGYVSTRHCIISDQGYLYIGTNDGKVRKIDKQGNIVWTISEQVYGIAAYGDYLYLGCYDAIKKVRKSDGGIIWTHTSATGLRVPECGMFVTNDGSYVYAGDQDDYVICLNTSDGSLRFSTNSDTVYNLKAINKNTDGMGVVASYESGKSYIINTNGSVTSWGGHSGQLTDAVVVADYLNILYGKVIKNCLYLYGSWANKYPSGDITIDQPGANDIKGICVVNNRDVYLTTYGYVLKYGKDMIFPVKNFYLGASVWIYGVAVDNDGAIYVNDGSGKLTKIKQTVTLS